MPGRASVSAQPKTARIDVRLPGLDALKSRARGKLGTRSGAAPSARKTSKNDSFHCVSVAAGSPACPAAHALEGRRFLPEEAPKLPLPDCNQAECDCAYRHHGDRRDGPRRDDDMGLPGLGFRPKEERRHAEGRRRDDGLVDADDEVTDYFGHGT